MPFTLAHPAIVLPFGFKKNPYIDFTALFLGAMAPDFEYYYRFRIIRTVGHTIAAQFYYNLPVILILAMVFHYIIKRPLVRHLPAPLNHWYYPLTIERWRLNTWKRWLVVIYSGIAGCFSHLLWDSFTHGTSYFAQRIPLLQRSFLGIPIYSLLQSGSSLIGLIAIVLFVYYMGINNSQLTHKNTYVPSMQKVIYWGGVLLITCLTLLIMHMIKSHILLGNLIVYTINGVFIGICIMSIGMRKKYKILS
ncbi:DUF4184 family protein [Vallitalea pronyensis]|uniref:DUF4184 family protein n=1 Tax=Vallitalea pronyensis TaxID=1348613 RepID=A0A8J8MJB5_9FIRM|nr:DUF4184 family protein [Vallitalea pronyensis]QUI22551.1 DUF4184 family protein [Vallitalea pronyensis]